MNTNKHGQRRTYVHKHKRTHTNIHEHNTQTLPESTKKYVST